MARQSVLVCVIIVAATAIVMIPACATAQLHPDVYKQSCPQALPINRSCSCQESDLSRASQWSIATTTSLP